MNKKPTPLNEAERLKALKNYNILDTAKEEEFDRLAELAALICGTPVAIVSLIDESRQWFKAIIGLDATETPRDISFCQFTIMGNDIVEITDTTKDERFVDNPLVISYPDISFYAGYPLTDPDGMNLGSLCVIDFVPKKLNEIQLKTLEILAKEVVYQIVVRKQNAERIKLEKLFNYSQDLICITDANGYFVKINPAFSTVLGYSEKKILSTPLLNFIHEDDINKTLLEVDKLSKGNKTVNFENRYIKKDGNYVNLNWLGVPDDDTAEIYAIARDVTEKSSILKQLKEAKIIAEKSVKVKDEFLSNMSHEIRTPLNAIIGFNDLLNQSILNTEQKKYVEIVRIASQNLMVIINDILDVSKMESGKLELEKRAINIKIIAENVINLQIQKAKEKGLKLHLSVDQDIPLFVTGDSTRISQVLINLVGNAIKFTDKGHVELKIVEIEREGNISTLRFSVKDTGVGIAKEKQEIIFERFSQAENSTTRIFGGTGLGLNISKMLVAMHDSKIELQSEEEKGSEFSFNIKFPISNAGTEIGKYTLDTVLSDGKLSGKFILIVEDNEHNQLLASCYLQKNGLIIDVAEDGFVAIEKLKKYRYDLILMDLQMPVMDGFTATKIIRDELKLDTPIVACSAHSLVKERQNCIENGMNDYISKPFSEKTLMDVLSFFLEDSPTSKNILTNITNNDGIAFDDFVLLLSNLEDEHGIVFVETMLEVYRRRIPMDMAELNVAIVSQDLNKIKEKCHLLRGSLSSLNFEVGSQLATNTEQAANSGNFEETKRDTVLLINYLLSSLKIIG